MSSVVGAGTRLHFGLFAAGGRFGGCGLMLQSPAITVSVDTSPAGWESAGRLAARAEGFARAATAGWPPSDHGAGLRVYADGPPEHVGLGIGTALGLAVAQAVSLWEDKPKSLTELAARVGRGKRSGIGLHGFAVGGFLVDAGRPAPDALPELVGRCDFPAGWRIVLVRPRVADRWSGGREQAAFDRPRPAGNPELLAEMATHVLLPAARRGDFDTFANVLGEYNQRAGEPFAADQGGAYGGPEVTAVVERLTAWGWRGVGQSSWGPTVFAVCPDESSATVLVERCRSQFPELDDLRLTAAKNDGAAANFY